MDFRDIEYFAVLAEHGHVGRAAAALGLSQPALSLSLRRLEQVVSARLFKRTAKGMELTDAGSTLLSQVQRLRLARDDVLREVADLSRGHTGTLRIGAHPGVIDNLLGPACSAMLNSAPNVTLAVIVEANDEAVVALREGRMDLIVGIIPPTPYLDVMQEHLMDDTMVIFAAASHRLARKPLVTLDDLEHERWTATAYSAHTWPLYKLAFQNSGKKAPRIVVQTTSLSFRDQLVASTDLLGTSSRRLLQQIKTRHDVVALPVKEFKVNRGVGVFRRKDAYLSPIARRFIELLRVTAQQLASAS